MKNIPPPPDRPVDGLLIFSKHTGCNWHWDTIFWRIVMNVEGPSFPSHDLGWKHFSRTIFPELWIQDCREKNSQPKKLRFDEKAYFAQSCKISKEQNAQRVKQRVTNMNPKFERTEHNACALRADWRGLIQSLSCFCLLGMCFLLLETSWEHLAVGFVFDLLGCSTFLGLLHAGCFLGLSSWWAPVLRVS